MVAEAALSVIAVVVVVATTVIVAQSLSNRPSKAKSTEFHQDIQKQIPVVESMALFQGAFDQPDSENELPEEFRAHEDPYQLDP